MAPLSRPSGVDVGGDLFLGRVLDAVGTTSPLPAVACISQQLRRRHVVLSGVSGVGKSSLQQLVVRSDVISGVSAAAYVDPVGSFVPPSISWLGAINAKLALLENTPHRAFNEWRRRQRLAFLRRVIYLDFGDENIGWRWNVLEPMDGLSVEATVGLLLRALEQLLGELSNQRRMLMLLRASFQLVSSLGGTLRDVFEVLLELSADDIDACLQRIQAKYPTTRPNVAYQFLRSFFVQLSQSQKNEVVASSINALGSVLCDRVVARFLSSEKSNISFNQIVNDGRLLFIHVPSGLDLNTSKILCALLADRIQATCEQRSADDVESGRVPTFNLVVDEFQKVIQGPHWAAAAAWVRNKKLALFFAHQCDSQNPFETEQGQNLLRSIRANSSTRIVMRQDLADAQGAAHRIFLPDGNMPLREEREITSTSSGSWGESKQQSQANARGSSRGHSSNRTEIGGDGSNQSTGNTGDTLTSGSSSSTSRSNSTGTGETQSRTQTTTTSSSRGFQRGGSKGRSIKTRRAYYGLEDEAKIRSYELASLKPREAYIWMNDRNGPVVLKFRVSDVPQSQSLITSFGGVDYVDDLLRIIAAPYTPPEPTEPFMSRVLKRDSEGV